MLNRPELEVAKRDAECRAQNGGLLTSATSWFGSTKEAKPGLATDEGDPGVVTGSTKAAPASAAKTK